VGNQQRTRDLVICVVGIRGPATDRSHQALRIDALSRDQVRALAIGEAFQGDRREPLPVRGRHRLALAQATIEADREGLAGASPIELSTPTTASTCVANAVACTALRQAVGTTTCTELPVAQNVSAIAAVETN